MNFQIKSPVSFKQPFLILLSSLLYMFILLFYYLQSIGTLLLNSKKVLLLQRLNLAQWSFKFNIFSFEILNLLREYCDQVEYYDKNVKQLTTY